MHFAVAVVTQEKPTESMLADPALRIATLLRLQRHPHAVRRHWVFAHVRACGIEERIGDGTHRRAHYLLPGPVERSSSRRTTIGVTPGWSAKRSTG
jgi:hypothetical protein